MVCAVPLWELKCAPNYYNVWKVGYYNRNIQLKVERVHLFMETTKNSERKEREKSKDLGNQLLWQVSNSLSILQRQLKEEISNCKRNIFNRLSVSKLKNFNSRQVIADLFHSIEYTLVVLKSHWLKNASCYKPTLHNQSWISNHVHKTSV